MCDCSPERLWRAVNTLVEKGLLSADAVPSDGAADAASAHTGDKAL